MRRSRRRPARTSLDRVVSRMSKARIQRSNGEQRTNKTGTGAAAASRDGTYRVLFERAPFGCVHLDLQGTVRDCNEAAALLLRTSRRQLTGRSFLTLISPDERDAFVERLSQMRTTRRHLAVTVESPDGPLRVHTSMLPRAAEPSRSAWLIIEDISQRLLDETRYFQLFNSAPVGYILLDRSGVVQESNETASRLLGVHSSTLIGKEFILFVAPSDRGAFLEHLGQVRSALASVEVELTLEAKDGRRVPAHVSTKSSPEYGSAGLSWTVLVDLSEQVRLQEAQTRAERERLEARHEAAMARARGDAKDRFLAALSHELRTPLTPALNATTLLANTPALPPGAEKLLSMIRRNIELEVRLIDDLLDVTRIGRNKLQLERSNVDFHALLRDALRMSASESEAKRITVTQELDAVRAFVYGDPIRLRQVIWNLINNAVKFTAAEGAITIRTSNDETGSLKFSITDNGIGFEPDAVTRLFVPFEQGSRAGGNRGLGLGLAICQGIVEAHGGRIWARSLGPGLGSTFEVELASLSPGVLTQHRTAAAKSRPPDGNHDHLRVLVVEDDPDSAETLAALIGLHGHAVETASRLSEGMARSDESWDVIITDIGLPDGSGLSLARHVRTRPHGPRSLVALSGFGSAADIEASHQAGFDVHLTKPVDISRVLEIFASLPHR